MEIEIAKKLEEWKHDPLKFFVEALGLDPDLVWGKMKEICDSVIHNRKTAIKAGHGVSKTFTVSRLALWYLYTHYPSTVFTTAPTHNQVEQVMWREIRDAINKAPINLGGKITTTKLELEDKWFAIGFATKPDQGQENATKIQGFHNDHVMIIFDEAAGIIKPIWEAKEGLLTNESAKFIAIGNPTQATGDFVDCFSDDTYSKITISVFDTPNYIQGREVVPGLSGREFVDSIKAKYGEDSNQWRSRVIGEIPDANANGLLTKQWIKDAENKKIVDDSTDEEKLFVVWDVADGGEDDHVIKAFRNKTEIGQTVVSGRKIEEVEPKVWRMLRRIRGNTIVVDADGVGRVAAEFLESSADDRTEIIRFMGSSTDVEDDEVFRNKRDEGHWMMRNDFMEGRISIKPNDLQFEELQSLRLTEEENPKGLIKMEKKVLLKKRIGRSPNYSDTIMMMCATYDDIEPVIMGADEYEINNSSSGYHYKNGGMAV